MGIEIWFKEAYRNILISANASSATTALCAPGPAMQTYRLGYQAALMAVALACGIPPDQVGIRLEADPRRRTARFRPAADRAPLTVNRSRRPQREEHPCGCAPLLPAGIKTRPTDRLGRTSRCFGRNHDVVRKCQRGNRRVKAGQALSQPFSRSAASIGYKRWSYSTTAS